MSTPPNPLDPYLIEQLATMQLRTQLIVESILSGRHPSISKLGSSEFSDYLKYSPGDEIRRIDWNVYAKSDRLYVRRFHDERALRCYLVVDLTASMDYVGPDETLKKFRYGIYLAAAIASILLAQHDLVSLMWPVVGNSELSVGYIPPKGGSRHLHQLLQVLEQAQTLPQGYTFPQFLAEGSAHFLPRSLIFVISDFLDFQNQEFHDLLSLGLASRLVALKVQDPWEYDFPFTGSHTFVHPESGEKVTLRGESVRQAYIENAQRYENQLQKEFVLHGVPYQSCLTSEPFEKPLLELFSKMRNLPKIH